MIADLRPYDKAVDFIGRAAHNTTGGYVDKISFTISPEAKTDEGGAVTAVAFSSSGIAGAYCDSGQNYKVGSISTPPTKILTAILSAS